MLIGGEEAGLLVGRGGKMIVDGGGKVDMGRAGGLGNMCGMKEAFVLADRLDGAVVFAVGWYLALWRLH